nr:MAG TPA: hypothetical protein [Caudoviricetes sp.]
MFLLPQYSYHIIVLSTYFSIDIAGHRLNMVSLHLI